MEQVSDLPNVRFYTANEDIQAGGLATVGIDGIVRAATSPSTLRGIQPRSALQQGSARPELRV